MTASSSLSINGLQFEVYLGVYPEERIHKQTVRLDARIHFPKPPKGCSSDRLEDTYCYSHLIAFLNENLAEKHFQLIENFTVTLYNLLKSALPTDVTLGLRVTKFPAIPGLSQGVTFEYSDRLSAW